MKAPNSPKPTAQAPAVPAIEFPPPMARGSEFPAPELSMLAHRLHGDSNTSRPLPGGTAQMLPVAWARNGLALVARALPAGATRVLAPAYHCPALVEPFIWAGHPVSFYPMAPDLAPDMAWLESNLQQNDILVLVPFFGNTATMAAPLQLARQRGCTVIEDLAHAAFKTSLEGDYGVTSLQKFYPVSCGGEILLSSGVDACALRDRWRNTISPEILWNARALVRRAAAKLQSTRKPAGALRYFNPAELPQPMPRNDRHILDTESAARISDRRRHCYGRLSRRLANSPLGRPLYPELNEGDTPYVFPLLLHNASIFRAIRGAALPLYRWEEIAPGDCKISADYRHRLVQLPCHQDLSEDDLSLLDERLAQLEQKFR